MIGVGCSIKLHPATTYVRCNNISPQSLEGLSCCYMLRSLRAENNGINSLAGLEGEAKHMLDAASVSHGIS